MKKILSLHYGMLTCAITSILNSPKLNLCGAAWWFKFPSVLQARARAIE